MAHELNLGGAIYISSKRAAEMTGYSQDYIGQLARSGAVIAQRVSGLWYIEEKSLQAHKVKADEYKPVPPPRPENTDLDTTVSFDGRDYVSTARGAAITGYNPDYVSQLARSDKIPSRQVGTRWYVDREALIKHKNHNDALLAAVQAESVGLARNNAEIPPRPAEIQPTEPHFNYISEDLTPVPSLAEDDHIADKDADKDADDAPPVAFESSAESAVATGNDAIFAADTQQQREEENEIPIRVLEPVRTMPRFQPQAEYMRAVSKSSRFHIAGFVAVIAIALAGTGYLYFTSTATPLATRPAWLTLEALPDIGAAMPASAIIVIDALRSAASNEMRFDRSNSQPR